MSRTRINISGLVRCVSANSGTQDVGRGRWRSLPRLAAAFTVLATVSVGTAGAAVAQAGGSSPPSNRTSHPPAQTGENHCVAPNGLDANEFYGVSQQIVSPFCTQVDAGEHWTVWAFWLTSESFDTVPNGFVPTGSTPLEDFLAKFVGVRYVIDPGTRQERHLFFPANGRTFAAPTPVRPGLLVVTPLTFTIARPLSVGDHVVRVSWVMSDTHCDGLGDDPAINCIPAGESLRPVAAGTQLGTVHFEVTPRAHHTER